MLFAGVLAPGFGAGGAGAAAGLVVVAVGGQGGPVARPARVLRRRRVFGGRPLAARRWSSSCRVFQAVRIRWLRTMSRVVVNSMRGASVEPS